jgi:acetate kinase
MEFLGIKLDNEKNRNKDIILTSEGSATAVLRVPTNEELVIAMDTAEIVNEMKEKTEA